MPMRIVDGFDSEVLPMPYHIAAMPTPRRMTLPLTSLHRAFAASAAARAACQRGRSASRQAASPASSAARR